MDTALPAALACAGGIGGGDGMTRVRMCFAPPSACVPSHPRRSVPSTPTTKTSTVKRPPPLPDPVFDTVSPVCKPPPPPPAPRRPDSGTTPLPSAPPTGRNEHHSTDSLSAQTETTTHQSPTQQAEDYRVIFVSVCDGWVVNSFKKFGKTCQHLRKFIQEIRVTWTRRP